MQHLDLFSGIGGFALAARRVGWETIGFCETDEYCRQVIEKNFNFVRWFSLPGSVTGWQTLGLEGDEIISRVRPDWIVIENTYHRWKAWMPELRGRLWERGYASLPLRVRAADVGAVHKRARGWVVANTDSEQLWKLSWWWSREAGKVATELAKSWDSAPRGLGADNGLPNWPHRRKALGNAIVPQCAELIFRAIDEIERTP